jgi:hypothetical protein
MFFCVALISGQLTFCNMPRQYDVSQVAIMVEEFKRQRIHPPDRNANGDQFSPGNSQEDSGLN